MMAGAGKEGGRTFIKADIDFPHAKSLCGAVAGTTYSAVCG